MTTAEQKNPYTVVGRYPGGKSVVVHVNCKQSMDARRSAVQLIAFDVYQGMIPEGLAPMNEAIGAISNDFDLVIVLEGHVSPAPDHRAGSFIFHGLSSEDKEQEDAEDEAE